MNNEQLLFMFVQLAEKNCPPFRHPIIGHAHIKPDIILSIIHLAQEGKVCLPSMSILFFFAEMKLYLVLMTGASRSQTSELNVGVTYSRQEAIVNGKMRTPSSICSIANHDVKRNIDEDHYKRTQSKMS